MANISNLLVKRDHIENFSLKQFIGNLVGAIEDDSDFDDVVFHPDILTIQQSH